MTEPCGLRGRLRISMARGESASSTSTAPSERGAGRRSLDDLPELPAPPLAAAGTRPIHRASGDERTEQALIATPRPAGRGTGSPCGAERCAEDPGGVPRPKRGRDE